MPEDGPFVVTTMVETWDDVLCVTGFDVVSRRAVATLDERIVFDANEWERTGFDKPEGNVRHYHHALLLRRYHTQDGDPVADVLFLHDGRVSRGHFISAMGEPNGPTRFRSDLPQRWDGPIVPGSGGTVGPLPDGTIIEVERWSDVRVVKWLRENGYRPTSPRDARESFVDAFNAAQKQS